MSASTSPCRSGSRWSLSPVSDTVVIRAWSELTVVTIAHLVALKLCSAGQAFASFAGNHGVDGHEEHTSGGGDDSSDLHDGRW